MINHTLKINRFLHNYNTDLFGIANKNGPNIWYLRSLLIHRYICFYHQSISEVALKL